jgi:hypothetical protein
MEGCAYRSEKRLRMGKPQNISSGITTRNLGRVLREWPQQVGSRCFERRIETCGELAAIAAQFTSEQGNLTGAVSTWQAWLDASQRSVDPRLTAMRATFARELVELQSASALS